MIGGYRYLNCGDWVESCTAIAETPTGEFQLIRWRVDIPQHNSVAATASQPAAFEPSRFIGTLLSNFRT